MHKYDHSIIEMMNKLGYSSNDIYTGLVTGNEHMNGVYQKLLKEKQEAAKFMEAHHGATPREKT